MAESRSITGTLESLLRATSTSTAPSTDLSTRSMATSSSWGSTVTALFGYGGTPTATRQPDEAGSPPGAGLARKAKPRARLPSWDPAQQHDEPSDPVGTARRATEDSHEVRDSLEADKVVDTILWQAGLDAPSRNDTGTTLQGALLVLACSKLPDPSLSKPNARLFEKLVARLEHFAAAGSYSIVLLANPTPFPPSTPQLVTSYLSLSRTTRKNLRKLWIVGGGWWTRVILTLFSTTLVSFKVSNKRKVVQCATLTELAAELGTERFTAIEFPLEVYTENAKLDREIKLPTDDEKASPVFGVPLKELCGPDGTQFPQILEDCLAVLGSQGPDSVGIFRRSPSAATVKVLELAYDRGHAVTLAAYPDAPYLAASLVKLFLRQLPKPVLPAETLADVARKCPLPDAPTAVEYVRTQIVPLIGRDERNVLERLVKVLHAVAGHSRDNLMTSANLVICLAPALVGGLAAVSSGVGGNGNGTARVTAEQVMGTIRVPGMANMGGTVSSSSSFGSHGGGGRGTNTLGGVLKVMIDHCDEVFGLTETVSSSPSETTGIDAALPAPASSPSRKATTTPTTLTPTRSESISGRTERTDVRGIFSTAPTTATQ